MKLMDDKELCEWLRQNSSGDYRPSALAADRIEQLLSAVNSVRDLIHGQDIDCFGSGQAYDGQQYPIRDEVLHNLTQAINGYETPKQG